MTDSHEVRELKYRLAQANKTMGRQGQTIRALRGELAVTRSEHSKIERGDIRRLEREQAILVDLAAKDHTLIKDLKQQNKALRDMMHGREFNQGATDYVMDSSDA